MTSNALARRVKRGLDISLGLAFGLGSLPLVAICAIVVKLTDPGPAFYLQRREGRGGRAFTMWKIRTMRNDAERELNLALAEHPERRREWHDYRRLAGDPRVIPIVGRFLRRTSLDELPQLWHVVAGEMSLVGPRPLELEVARGLAGSAIEIRRAVRPGVTGLWQVEGRSDNDLARLLEIDVRYVTHWSLALDLRILCRTPGAVFSARGAH